MWNVECGIWNCETPRRARCVNQTSPVSLRLPPSPKGRARQVVFFYATYILKSIHLTALSASLWGNVVNLKNHRLCCPRFSGESGSRRLTKGVQKKRFLFSPLPPAFAGPPSPLKWGRLFRTSSTASGPPSPRAGKAR